MDLYWYHYWN